MPVGVQTALWCWVEVIVVVATAAETIKLAVRARVACNVSIRDSVVHPNYATPFRSSDVILVQGAPARLAILRACNWIVYVSGLSAGILKFGATKECGIHTVHTHLYSYWLSKYFSEY